MHTRIAPLLFVSTLLFGAFGPSGVAAANTTIVNIDGSGPDGSGVATGYGYPLAPGSLITMVDPVVVDLAAGDYTISDGWGLSGARYDAWNYQLGVTGNWLSHFYVAVAQGTADRLLIDGLSAQDPVCTYANCSWATEAQASAAFLRTPSFALHLDADTAVLFSVTDYDLLDNAGGVSLAVTPVPSQTGSVPEPGTTALLLASSLPMLWLRRKRADRGGSSATQGRAVALFASRRLA